MNERIIEDARAVPRWAWTAVAIVVLIACYCGWLAHHDADVRERAALAQKLHASDSLLAALAVRAATKDTAYVTDTVRLTRVKAHTDTVLAVLHDSIVHVDTVRMIVQAERQACSAVVQTCEQRVALRDSTIQQQRAEIGILKRLGNPKHFGWSCGLGAGADVRGKPDAIVGCVYGWRP